MAVDTEWLPRLRVYPAPQPVDKGVCQIQGGGIPAVVADQDGAAVLVILQHDRTAAGVGHRIDVEANLWVLVTAAARPAPPGV